MAEKIKLGTNGNFGVKEGGTLAYNDENGVFKAIELASSRSSAATYVAESGLIADAEVGVPRIDWTNGVGELLLEPQSTNLCDISKVDAYAGSGTIIRTLNDGIGVTGLNDAVKLEKGSASAEYFNLRVASTTLSATSDYTHSVFVKRDDVDFDFRLEHNISTDYGFSWNVDFTITDSGVTINSEANATGKVEAYSNGWYRVSAVVTTSSPTTAITSYLFRLKASNGIGASIFIQDHQIEKQSCPTSYIRTSGSQVTRIADAVTGNSSLSQVINSSEGVLYFEGSALADIPSGNLYFSICDGSNSNSIFFRLSTTGALIAYNSGLTSPNNIIAQLSAGSIDLESNFKLSIRWGSTSDDFQLFVNGSKVTQQVGFVFSSLSGMNELIFSLFDGSGNFYGRIRELKVYDTALTDAELTALTTL